MLTPVRAGHSRIAPVTRTNRGPFACTGLYLLEVEVQELFNLRRSASCTWRRREGISGMVSISTDLAEYASPSYFACAASRTADSGGGAPAVACWPLSSDGSPTDYRAARVWLPGRCCRWARGGVRSPPGADASTRRLPRAGSSKHVIYLQRIRYV